MTEVHSAPIPAMPISGVSLSGDKREQKQALGPRDAKIVGAAELARRLNLRRIPELHFIRSVVEAVDRGTVETSKKAGQPKIS